MSGCVVCGAETKRFASSGRPHKYCADHSYNYTKAFRTRATRIAWLASPEQRAKSRARDKARFQTPEGKAIHLLKKAWRRQKVKEHTVSRLPSAWARELLQLDSCAYCLKPLSNGIRSIDHVTPLSRGGAHDTDNVVLACMPCNARKGAKTLIEFVQQERAA